MLTVENVLYIRLILLLTRAGCGVLRKLVAKSLQKQSLSLVKFLQKNKKVIINANCLCNTQLKLMFPHLSDPPDLLKWDISLLCYLILDFLEIKNSSVYKAVMKIRDMRNEFLGHYADASIDVDTYSKKWAELNYVIIYLSSSFTETETTEISELIQSAADANLNMKTVLSEIHEYNPSEDFFEHIGSQVKRIADTVQNYQQDMLKIQQDLFEIKNMVKNNDQSKIVNTVFGQVKLTALDEKVVDSATKWLLQATENSIRSDKKARQTNDLQEKVDSFIQDIENTGVKVTDVKEGSVLLTVECSTINSLLELIDYFQGPRIQSRLDEIGKVLGDKFSIQLTLEAVLELESLQDIVTRFYQTRVLKVGMTCSGIEGLQHALDVFEGDVASNSLNDMSNFLTKSHGKRIVVESAIDLESMRKAVNSAKEQIENGLKSVEKPPEKQKAIEPYTVGLQVKITPSDKISSEQSEKILICIKDDIEMWHKQKCGTDVLKNVQVDNVKVDTKKKLIRISFILHSDEDLEHLYSVAKKTETEQPLNILSQTLTTYLIKTSTCLRKNFPDMTEVVLKVVLAERQFYNGKSHFSKYKEEEEEDSTDSDSSSENGYKSLEDEEETDVMPSVKCKGEHEADSVSSETEMDLLTKQGKHSAQSCFIENETKHFQDIEKADSETSKSVKNLLESKGLKSLNIKDAVHHNIEDKTEALSYISTGNVNLRDFDNESTVDEEDTSVEITGSDYVHSLDFNIEKRDTSDDSSTTFKSVVQHTFLLALPSHMTTVQQATLYLPSMKSEYIMHLHAQSQNIYEVSFHIPVDLQPETQYFYKINYKLGFWKYATKDSGMLKVQSKVVHRDYCFESPTFEDIAFHFKDIMFCSRCNDKYTEPQLCEQIQDINALKSNWTGPEIIKLVKMLVNVKHQKSQFLLTFIMSILCIPGKVPIVPDIIRREHAERILCVLSERRIKSLPSEVQYNMRFICRLLTKEAFDDRWCPLLYLQACYPFFDDEFVLELVKENIRAKKTLVPENVDSKAICKSLCEKLAEGSCDQNPENVCRRCLLMILENVPKETAIYVYRSIRLTREILTEDEQYFQDVLHDIAKKIVRQAIKHTKDFGKLINFAKFVCETDSEKQAEFCDEFEEAILNQLSYVEPKVGKDIVDDMKSLLRSTECFKMPYQQEKVLNTVVESANEHIFELFVELIEVEGFVDTYSKISSNIYKKWFQTDRISGHQDVIADVSDILSHFSKIYRIAETTARNDVADDSKCLTVNKLEGLTLTDLLAGVYSVQELCDKDEVVGTLFKTHILERLKSKRLKPYDVLDQIFGSARCLCIETRFTSDLVISIMEQLLARQENVTDQEYFIFLTSHFKSLKKLFNVTGKFKEHLQQSKIMEEIKLCISNIRQHFESQEVSLQFVKQINDHETNENVKKLLLLLGGSVDNIELSLQSYFDAVENKACCIWNVLSVLKKRKPKLPGIDLLQDQAEAIKTRIQKGVICAKECRPENEANLWGLFKPFLQAFTNLEKIIKSDVFWNLTKYEVDTSFDDHKIPEDNDDYEKDVQHLFDKEIEEEEKIDSGLCYLSLLQEKGVTLYQKGWFDLEQEKMLPMENVSFMFKDTDVIQEIALAAEILRRPIEPVVKETLEMLSKRNEILGKVETMKLFLEVFCPELTSAGPFQQVFESFENLFQQNMLKSQFAEVQELLRTVFEQAKVLSSDSITIMSELRNASHLIEFLRTIAHDDIRTLVDAVEQISEQHIQESTVSGLIEVKRFVYPFLDRKSIEEKGSRWLFQTVNKQVEELGEDVRTMASKIDDCKNNIHNLKSLIGNAANRGEQTKEVISSIVKKGTISFRLDNKVRNVCFEAKYTHNSKKTVKSETTLIDLRSRALLLMNSERTTKQSSFNREEFKLFINSVDLCTDIKDILSDLFTSGHVMYTDVKITKTISALSSSKKNMSKDLKDWTKDLKRERKNFYLLNFINNHQIPILNQYLKEGKEEDIVHTILKFIHPKMKSNCLLSAYTSHSNGDKEMLQRMGKSLNLAHEGLELFRREMKTDIEQKADMVHKGQIQVVNLERNSSLVIKTVLALYNNTSQNFPEPNQMLFCTRETRWNEIELLLERCFGALSFYKYLPLFCIANVEMLGREIQDLLVQAVDSMTGKSVFLAIVCKGSENLFRSKLSEQIETVRPVSDEEVSKIMQSHCPKIVTYTSDVAGLGKSTTIFSAALSSGFNHKTLHISGTFWKGKTIEQFRNMKLKGYHFLHIDIGNVLNPNELDIFLFELIILRYVSVDGLPYYLETENVSIEIANTINDTLINALHFATSFKRVHLSLKDYAGFLPSKVITSASQVVCHFLDGLDRGILDKKEIHFSGKHKVQPLENDRCQELMKKYIPITDETSFNNIHIFLNVLSEQLKKLSVSKFFRNAHIKDMIEKNSVPSIRSTLVNAMIRVALEFSSRSVQAIRSVQTTTSKAEVNNATGKDDIVAEKSVQRVECMIRWEDSNHLIFVFHNQNIQTLTPMYRDKSRVENHVQKLFERQMNKQLIQFSDMSQEELQGMLQKIARKKINPHPQEYLDTLSKDYALTPDNLLKMVLIMMRLQAKVPVILMGETGCGKTSLIRYLSKISEVPFKVMNIHAGTSIESIIEQIEEENDSCCQQLMVEKWLFLDEINTSQHIGLISDAICHHLCLGKVLAPNLVIMGACNPYKLRSEDATRTAGLEGKIRSDELSRLVYRVLPLPETMIDYVWDFGFLSEQDEEKYIKKMIEDVFQDKSAKHLLLKKLLTVSQSFVRDKENAAFSVSLRDVYRCKTLVKWFAKSLPQKQDCKNRTVTQNEIEMRSIILALAHCYHSRFSNKEDRRSYRQVLVSVFVSLGNQNFKEDDIHSVIKEEQKDILQRMELPPGIARNTALQENVFMLLVCILNKIPIFLVGKPGCSKSLAMQVIRSNIRGKDSKDAFFKKLPQLHCVSFQGSESSTSDGICIVFEKAERYQQSYARDDVLSVVILDEIGLAEISGLNPLKVLHSLLEPDGKSQPNVAVVGISNWALDASKMNRAIHLSRPDMDLDELIETGIFISESFIRDVKPKRGLTDEYTAVSSDDIKEDLEFVAKSYSSYTKSLKFKNFHGLRDYYFLVKFITRTLAEKNRTLSDTERASIIMTGLQRNFGGLPKEKPILLHHFRECFRGKEPEQRSTYDLVVSNIKDSSARHLLLITKGESVLAIVEDILRDVDRDNREIIFGSHFEDDLTDDYNYRILSKIIMCMEQGVVLILKDLEKIYGSLYDMLNQNYTRIGAKNNCRVALGPYSNPFCHVADSFRCIVLVDERKLDYTDPPFLNRFEKQFLTYGSIIDKEKRQCLKEVEKWLDELSTIDGKSFTKEDMFPIYNEEMMVSLVMFNNKKSQTLLGQDKVSACKKELLWLLRPEAVVRFSNTVRHDPTQQNEEIKDEYFALPINGGINELVKYQMKDLERSEQMSNMTIVFTNSNIHTNIKPFVTDWSAQFEKLQTFKSEKQLSSSIEQFWNEEKHELLFLQCSAVEDERHIMLTKTIIERYSISSRGKNEKKKRKLVFLAIHLDGSDISTNTVSQINYLSGWKLIMMDTLESPTMSLRHLCSTDMLTIIKEKRPFKDCLKKEMFWAFTKIRYGSYGRDHESIKIILETVKSDDDFLSMIEERICADIKRNFKGKENANWQMNVACDVNALSTSENFVEALECFLLDAIKHPLAKIIFKLETLGAVNSYFEGGDGRKRLWKYIFQNETLFSISEIQNEFGPWCYSCERADLSLVMPFSRVIFENIEATREDFLDEIPRLRAKCDVDTNEALPDEVTNELVQQQQNYMFKRLPDLQEYEYENMKADYMDDFCNLVSFTTCASLQPKTRILLIKCAITQNIDSLQDYSEVFARLHCTFWANATLFGSFMLLLESCVEVFDEKELLKFFKEPLDTNVCQADRVDLTKSSRSEGDTDCHSSGIEVAVSKKDLDTSVLQNNQSSMFVFGDESMLKDESFHQFISLICSKVLPSPTNLKKFDDAHQWQLKARSVMTVAAEVSREPKKLHALRFCDDVATHFLFPHKEPISKLEQIGVLLKDKELDSETVFKAVLNLEVSTDTTEETEKLKTKHRIFSQYFIRCINSDPETKAYIYFFQQVKEGGITDESIGLFKAPLHVLLYLEFTDNAETLNDLVRPNDCITESNSPVSPNKFTSSFLSELDICLNATIQSKAGCSFNVLIVDLLQEFYSETKHEDYSSLLLQCGTILQTDSGGLKFIAAISLLKVIIANIGELVSEHKKQNQTVLLTVLNATYTGIMQRDISKTLRIFLLKIIANNFPLNTVLIYHESLKEKCDSLGKISWTAGYSQVCFDRNPLSLFVSDHKRHEKLFSAVATENTTKQNMKNLVEISRTSCEGLLFLYALFMREIYLARFFETIKDSKSRKLELISELLKKSGHSDQKARLLLCLMGKENFRVDKFMHREKTPAKQYFILSVLVSSYSLVLAYQQCKSSEYSNIFEVCLMKPEQLKTLFIPGFPDTEPLGKAHFAEFRTDIQSFASCTNCSLRLAFKTKSKEQECPVCKNVLQTNTQYQQTSTEKPLKQRKGLFCFENYANEHFQVRNRSPITCNILNILVKGCVLGSFALGFSSLTDISKNQTELMSWTEEHIWEEITLHWTNIAKLLNFDDHRVAVFLHAVMLKAQSDIFEQGNKISSLENRDDLEKNLDDIVIDMLQEKFSVVIDHLQTNDALYGFSNNTVELKIREADDITLLPPSQQNELLPRLLRVSENPSKNDFIFQLKPEQTMYPFLVLVLSHEHNLDLPQNIHNIIQWHLVTVVHTMSCFSLKSYECSKMSVQDFFDKIPGLKNRDLAKKRFEAFKSTWGTLTKVLDKSAEFRNLHTINTQSSLNDCLILEEESIVFKVLSYLVGIQNDFIDCSLSLCFDCDNLYFLSRNIGGESVSVIKNLPITETRREHFVSMSFDWVETLKRESHSHLSYGQGRYVHYEFGSIEKELIAELLVGKVYLNLSVLPKILFTDQLYRKYASLVEEVCVSVKQESLPSDIACSIRKNNEDNKGMARDLINYLDMVMTLLQKMKCNDQKPLVDFAAERSNILGRPLPRNCLPNPDSSIKLCHVVSLHELLEELCADPLIEGLNEKYCAKIDDHDIQEHFENMPKVSMKTAEIVVRALKRFVYRCMSMTEAVDAEQPVIRYLSHKSFWPEGFFFEDDKLLIGEKGEAIDTVIPTNVFVCHVQAIVILLTERIERITQGEDRIDKAVTDWKTAHIKNEGDSKIMKRRKMLKLKKT